MWKTLGRLALAAAVQVSVAHVATAKDFYDGKQINLYVGYNPGGTYDLYSRIAAQWLPNYIPGKPAIVVQNMPGAGGALAANYLYSQASKDGLSIGMISQAAALQQVIKAPGIRYDVSKFNWLGRLTPVVEVTVVWNTSPAKTIEEAENTKITLAGTSAGGTSSMMPSIMNAVVGTKFDVILGYPGTTGAEHAMEMGETDGAHSTEDSLLTQKQDWLKDKKVSVLVQYAQDRDPGMPDVPAMTEFGKTDEDKQILGLFGSTAEIGRSLLAPPDVPQEEVDILRTAFDKMVADPAFQKAVKDTNLTLGPMAGKDLQARIEKTVALPESTVDRVVNLLKDQQ